MIFRILQILRHRGLKHFLLSAFGLPGDRLWNLWTQISFYVRLLLTNPPKLTNTWYGQVQVPESLLNNTRDGMICLLNHDFDLKQPDIWGASPDRGCYWPRQFYKYYNLGSGRIGDYKLVWELGRLQFLPGLLVHDPQMGLKVLRSYLNYNWPLRTIHWYSEMEVGIRLITLMICIPLLEHYSSDCVSATLKLIDQHYLYLRDNLTTRWAVPNNHVLIEVSSLLCYEMLSNRHDARKLRHWSVLEREINKQIYSDGGLREQSTSYARFNLDAFLLLWLVCSLTDNPVPDFLAQVVERMLEFVMYLQTPDGTIPMVGDADDGRVIPAACQRSFWDFRGHLALGAVLCNRSDFKGAAGSWDNDFSYLVPPQFVERFAALPSESLPAGSHYFPASGYWAWRSTPGNQADYILFRAGEFGLGGDGYSSHSHCDELSLVIYLAGFPILVDCGTFTYDQFNKDWRAVFRENRAHNVIQVDGRSQAVYPAGESFCAERVPRAQFTNVTDRAATALFGDRNRVFIWQRTVQTETDNLIAVTDIVSLQQPDVHTIRWFFNFHPSVKGAVQGDSVRLSFGGQSGRLSFKALPIGSVVSLNEGYYSEYYNQKEKNQCLEVTVSTQQECMLQWTLGRES